MDSFSSEKRSNIMRSIKGKDTIPEKKVRSLLHKMGYRFTRHSPNLPGKPDICLPKYKTIVLVHGCYWHRHKNCKRGRSMPSSNMKFWKEKFEKNVLRDKKVRKALKNLGWEVITVWQCELSKPQKLSKKLKRDISQHSSAV